QGQIANRDQAQRFVGGRGAHVCQLLFADNIYVQVDVARVFADDHTLVDRGLRFDEDLAALLQVVDGVARRVARTVRDQAARASAVKLALPFAPSQKQRVEQSR